MSLKSALLVQGIQWKSEHDRFELLDGIYLEPHKAGRIRQLYEEECKNKYVDDGDPFTFDFNIVFPPEEHDEVFLYYGGPHSIISQICNLIVIATTMPFGLCRLVGTKDDFKSCWGTIVIYDWNPDMDYLRRDPDLFERDGSLIQTRGDDRAGCDLTDDKLVIIRTMLETLRAMREPAITSTRINNALDFFFYAWRSYYMPHVCMNLAIVLETLFSPAANTDISQRVAFHVCRFCGNSEEERVALFTMIKKFYGLRSKIVHGDKPKEHELYELTPRVFHLVAWLLSRLLSDWELVETFGNDKKREKMMNQWLFR